MPMGLLIQPRPSTEHLIATLFGNARAVVFHAEFKALCILGHGQANLGIRPFAGVIQQIAQQFQQVLTIPGQLQAGGCAVTQRQVFAMDHVQGGQQSGEFGIAIKQCAR
ncbi:hypothetical protein D3C78_1642400 [compost metagenome]